MADLNTDVRYIKGIGEQRAKALGKLGIATLRDLISYFPRAYDDRSALRRIADLVPGETAGVAAMVASPPTISHIRKGLDLVKLRAVDDTRHPGCDLFQPGVAEKQPAPGRDLYLLWPGGGLPPPASDGQSCGGARRGGGRSPAASCPSIPLPPESAS